MNKSWFVGLIILLNASVAWSDDIDPLLEAGMDGMSDSDFYDPHQPDPNMDGMSELRDAYQKQHKPVKKPPPTASVASKDSETDAIDSNVLNIMVVGLFKDQAVVEINKKRRVLKVGVASPEGVTLISANSRGAVLEKGGVSQSYELGTHISSNFAPPTAQPSVSIWPTNGMYVTAGSVNGYSVDFLVDTGASSIALNAATAKRLDLDYLSGKKIGVKTASGVEVAYHVMLDNVQVGDIKLTDVRAMVFDGAQPDRALLGMSFLSQVDIDRKDDRMELKKRF